MKTVIKIFIVITVFSCKEKPNYNPFDDQFNVSVHCLAQDNCDSISAGCGYYNLIQRKGKLRTYYQIELFNDPTHVVAKGFDYNIDTFKVKNAFPYFRQPLADSVINLPLKIADLNQEFGRFGYKVFSRDDDIIQLFNPELNNKVDIRIVIHYIDEQHITRGFDYFKSKRRTQKPSFLDWLKECIRDIGQTEIMEETEEIVDWEEIEGTEDTEE